MADGEEEREELQQRIEEEKRKDRDDRIDRGEPDPWQPEQGGS